MILIKASVFKLSREKDPLTENIEDENWNVLDEASCLLTDEDFKVAESINIEPKNNLSSFLN